MKETQTRLWWIEMIRGIVIITFGLLFIFIDVRFFIYALGIYLIFDGTLDVYKGATGQLISSSVPPVLGGALSILLGLISLAYHILTILLLILIIIARIIISAVRAISDALRSRSSYTGVIWLYAGLLVLSCLIILLFPAHALFFSSRFLFVFISAYALCDGCSLLVRGLLLRFAPAVYLRSTRQIPEGGLDIPGNLPATTRRAVVFVRRPGANGLGHIAWAFEWHNGWFNAGSVENEAGKPFARPEEMGFWTVHTLDPVATMQKQSHKYDEFKLFYVTQPQPKEAWRTVVWESRQPYVGLRHNCNDVAYDVLRVYGTSELLDPAQEHVPNDWYDALPGCSYTIAEHAFIPLHLHRMSQRELATREIQLTIPPHIKGTPPLWRLRGRRAWEELTLAWDKMLKDVKTLFIRIEEESKYDT